MEAVADAAYDVGSVALAGGIENFDLSFLPKNLTTQCQSLIVSYHELHGYACLPNVLWKARLGHFIEAHQEFRQLLKKASTTRSAKKSNLAWGVAATVIVRAGPHLGGGPDFMAGSDPAGRPPRARLGHRQRPRGPSLFLDRSQSRRIAATPGAPSGSRSRAGLRGLRRSGIPVGCAVLVRVSC